jgi:hypothetical protein
MFSDFRSGVVEVFVLLGFYAALVDCCLLTFQDVVIRLA